MAKRTDIKKILIIGSGPIVIGQAAEFDYAGTQACLALKEEGYEVVLANSNPATIMTDTTIADKIYMEPLTLEYVAKILRHERPDAIVPGIGGQTGLNLAMQLEKKGILRECGVELLGTSSESIERAEDREGFKKLCEELGIGEPTLNDIVEELEKPGRDVRDSFDAPILRDDVLDINSLKPGMVMTGTVRNVIDFGAFVDIGVHQDGLVHISRICDKFIKHPSEVLSVGDIVRVQVLEVDTKRNRIALTMRFKEEK